MPKFPSANLQFTMPRVPLSKRRAKRAIVPCMIEGCEKRARGGTSKCFGHGGGKRCKFEGCTRGARGKAGVCVGHGGGRRCAHRDKQDVPCRRGAQGSSNYCMCHLAERKRKLNCDMSGSEKKNVLKSKSRVSLTQFSAAHLNTYDSLVNLTATSILPNPVSLININPENVNQGQAAAIVQMRPNPAIFVNNLTVATPIANTSVSNITINSTKISKMPKVLSLSPTPNTTTATINFTNQSGTMKSNSIECTFPQQQEHYPAYLMNLYQQFRSEKALSVYHQNVLKEERKRTLLLQQQLELQRLTNAKREQIGNSVSNRTNTKNVSIEPQKEKKMFQASSNTLDNSVTNTLDNSVTNTLDNSVTNTLDNSVTNTLDNSVIGNFVENSTKSLVDKGCTLLTVVGEALCTDSISNFSAAIPLSETVENIEMVNIVDRRKNNSNVVLEN